MVSDIKWIKVTTNMFEDEKVRLIDAMPERDTIHYIWMRLLVQAGKANAAGFIFLTENIPYSDEMLATLFCRPLTSIRLALKVLSDFRMIEVAPDNIIKILNWDKHQNIEGMERVRAQNRKRVEVHREKKKQLEKTTKDINEENEEGTNIDNFKEGSRDKQWVNFKEDNGENQGVNAIEGKIENQDSNVKVNDKITSLDNNENFFVKATNENYCSITNNSLNFTHDESNVTVTQQNKIENKNKNKNKNKKEIESEKKSERDIECESVNNIINAKANNICSIDVKIKESGLSEGKNPNENPIAIGQDDIDSKAMELMTYHEKITGIKGGLNDVALRFAINMYGENAVKMAIDRALEANHIEMEYINGILKNWKKSGYPNEGDEIKNGVRSNGKNTKANKSEFAGIKPKKARNLTEAERKGAEENLI